MISTMPLSIPRTTTPVVITRKCRQYSAISNTSQPVQFGAKVFHPSLGTIIKTGIFGAMLSLVGWGVVDIKNDIGDNEAMRQAARDSITLSVEGNLDLQVPSQPVFMQGTVTHITPEFLTQNPQFNAQMTTISDKYFLAFARQHFDDANVEKHVPDTLTWKGFLDLVTAYNQSERKPEQKPVWYGDDYAYGELSNAHNNYGSDSDSNVSRQDINDRLIELVQSEQAAKTIQQSLTHGQGTTPGGS